MNRTELMSPAGHWPQMHAAIEAGADAVYFGLTHFSARAKVGFTLNELREAIRTLHRRGVKGYVTFNTLVFENEINPALDAIVEIYNSGADAVIVQDVGMAKLIQRAAPHLPIHGSTQMSVTSAEGCELARSLGCSRVVLARELSLVDIGRIAQATSVELETFVHGALCVSYSGQCFSSEAWGGRSANRGQCAQACRLDYDLEVDGQRRDLGPARYLLSPGDLMAIEQVPELVRLGVHCLKIEGRYKDAEYVALTTQAYRQALDQALAGQTQRVNAEQGQRLTQIYSRGLGPHFIAGTNHQSVVTGRSPRHRGVFVGRVERVHSDSVEVRAEVELANGDGVVFDAADRRGPEHPEQGGFVFDVQTLGNSFVRLEFDWKSVQLRDIQVGDWVWRTLDPKLEKETKRWLDTRDPIRTEPLEVTLLAKVDEVPKLRLGTRSGIAVEVVGAEALSRAKQHATTLEQIQTQLGRLGGTPFHVHQFSIEADSDVFVPTSVLNQLRRSAVERLIETMETEGARSPLDPMAIQAIRDSHRAVHSSLRAANLSNETPQIHVLVRTPEQLLGALESGCDSITLDYLELYGLKQSVTQVKQAGIVCRIASPRVLKPDEQRVIRFLLSLESPLLVRSGGLLQGLLGQEHLPERHGDFSLNIANSMSAEMMLQTGLSRFAFSHDLNAQQIAELSQSLDPNAVEVVALQHLPIFHMEHCVFCRFLSSGTDNTNCGHPCEKHRIAVVDREGRRHPVLADVGCRNTVFNAPMQSSARHLRLFLSVGIRHFRLEFVHQTAAQVGEAVRAIRRYLVGDLSVPALEKEWSGCSPEGITEGSLFVPKSGPVLVQLQ